MVVAVLLMIGVHDGGEDGCQGLKISLTLVRLISSHQSHYDWTNKVLPQMRCPVLLLLVIRVAWGATSSPSSPSAGEPALQTPGAPDLLQPDSPRKVSHHNHPEPEPDPDPDPDAQAAPSILDIFPQDLLTSRCPVGTPHPHSLD